MLKKIIFSSMFLLVAACGTQNNKSESQLNAGKPCAANVNIELWILDSQPGSPWVRSFYRQMVPSVQACRAALKACSYDAWLLRKTDPTTAKAYCKVG